MFDPNHNAVKGPYYLVDGSLLGSWEGLDRDVVVVPWHYEKRAESLRFFAARGHRPRSLLPHRGGSELVELHRDPAARRLQLDGPGDPGAEWIWVLEGTPDDLHEQPNHAGREDDGLPLLVGLGVLVPWPLVLQFVAALQFAGGLS